jgi:hypothetical protein
MSDASDAKQRKVTAQSEVFGRFLKRVIPSEAEGPAFTV